MQFPEVSKALQEVLSTGLPSDTMAWIQEKIKFVSEQQSTKDLFLTYSLLASKVKTNQPLVFKEDNVVHQYLQKQEANAVQIGRIYFLASLLEKDVAFFSPKIANIIQVADTGELETFLKFLVLLPNAADYKLTAVDALRTNIAVIFDAIAMHNPYPALYFSEKEWNQMYLKATFMERDITQIQDVEAMANQDLARIISDYAHERWAAGRVVFPYFWRPVGPFLEDALLGDMERLLQSENKDNNYAAVLCCLASEHPKAKALLEQYKDIQNDVEENKITWEKIK